MKKEKKVSENKTETKQHKALDSAIDDIKARFGEGAIMKLSETNKVNVDAIPTGSIAMDQALGVGGMPRGRIIEVYGAESSGKTTLCLHVVAEAQKKGGVCAYIDAEHAMDPDYAKRLGVNTGELLISQPDSGEHALQIVETLVNTKNVDVIVVDSVAALTPQREIEGEIGDQHMGLQARMMSQACLVGETELIDPVTGNISTIEKIVERKEPWNTLTYDQNKRKFIISKVTDWLPQGQKEVSEVITKDGHILKLTKDHLVLTFRGWKEVKDLTKEDSLAIPYKIPEVTKNIPTLNDDEIKTVAYILGDGNFTNSNYALGFANIDKEVIKDFNGALRTLDCELNQKSYKDFQVIKNQNLPLGSYKSPAKVLLKKLGLFGKKSPQKDIPSEIFQLSNKKLGIFISRLWSCDGHIDLASRAIIYSSSSLKLIKQLQLLLLRFGIVSRWSQKRPVPHVLYKLIIQGEKNIKTFSKEIGLVGQKTKKLELLATREWKSKKMPFQEVIPYQMVSTIKELVYASGHNGQEISHLFGFNNRTSFPEFKPTRLRVSREHLRKISDFIGNKEIREIADEEVYWTGIESILPIGKKEVFDITVKDVPNFVANGVVVHNCRKLSAIAAKSNTMIIFINQTRMKIGMVFGNPETTPGGLALKFYASVRVNLARTAQIKSGDEIIGNRVKAKIVKNKVAAPFRVAEFDIYYNEGISKSGDALRAGLASGMIKQSGASFTLEGEKMGAGTEAAKTFLKEHPEAMEKIKASVVQQA